MLTIRIYEDKAGEYRWRMVAPNGRIVADSAEGYTTHSGAKRAIKRVLALLKQGTRGLP